jgi:hypothetical protein
MPRSDENKVVQGRSGLRLRLRRFLQVARERARVMAPAAAAAAGWGF